MQKTFYNILVYFLAISLVMLVSCEKVIDVDLNEVQPTVVIEAELNGTAGRLEVKISKTASYFGAENPPMITGATVSLRNENGIEYEAVETEQGVYLVENLKPEYGTAWYLSVLVDGQTYQAQSILYPPVEIVLLNYFYESGGSIFDQGYYLRLDISDPPDQQNYYRVKLYKNGRLQNNAGDLILFSDNYLEGKEIQVTLRGTMFREGDLARALLITIDQGAYDFLRTFDDLLSTNPGSAAPANPVSNFSNGALGYFSAYSLDEESVIIDP